MSISVAIGFFLAIFAMGFAIGRGTAKKGKSPMKKGGRVNSKIDKSKNDHLKME